MLIYKITNNINGKIYIGQTRYSLEKRKSQHYQKFKSGVKTKLYSAFRKYGWENFHWEVLEYANSKDKLNKLEIYYIELFDSIHNGYNMVAGGNSNVMDIPSVRKKHNDIMRSEEVRNKISRTLKEYRKNNPFTKEHRQRLHESMIGNHNFGSGDTRSIPVYCIYKNKKYLFHSIKEGGMWWFETLKPFPYNEATYQRKIKQNIRLGYCLYGREHVMIDNIKWYYEKEEVINNE